MNALIHKVWKERWVINRSIRCTVLAILIYSVAIERVLAADGPLETPPVASYIDKTESTPQKVSWFRRHFGRVEWPEAVYNSNSAKDVCSFVSGQLHYRKEKSDKWMSAANTWDTRRGDCEDYAVCVVEMCKEIGIDSWIELHFPNGRGEGHAIAVGHLDEDRYWISSLGGFEVARSRDEINEVVAAMLWCKKDEVWTATLDYEDIQRYIAKNN